MLFKKGEKIERPKEPARTNVVNPMEALPPECEGGGRKAVKCNASPTIKRPPLSLPRARVAVTERQAEKKAFT